MNLDFLKNVTVSAAPEKKVTHDTSKKVRVPETANTIRLFKDGSVYPSVDLTANFNLDYGARDADGRPTNSGLDVIDSRDMTNQLTTPVAFVGVSPTPRFLGKLDLFAATKYNDDDTPTASVNTQGSSTFGKEELIPLLEQVYGDNFAFNAQGYCDLQVVTDQPIEAPGGRWFFYKKVVRGKDAGKKTYVIRDGAIVYLLVPTSSAPDAASIPSGDSNTEAESAEKGTGKKVTA